MTPTPVPAPEPSAAARPDAQAQLGDLQHVAVIMDGNGRWAEERGLARLEGHRQGAKVVRDITTYARELGLRYLTLYSFSRQNWRRPPLEVAGLMGLLQDYCRDEYETLMHNEIRLTTIGDTARLPSSTREALQQLAYSTRHNDKMVLCLAVDYGGREEIVGAVRRLAQECARGALAVEAIDEAALAARLDTANMPDPDLLLRTSGECRVSNFLLWQLAYAELSFSNVRWPDFTREHFAAALQDYAQRQRRFGCSAVPEGQAARLSAAELHDAAQQKNHGAPARAVGRLRPETDYHEGRRSSFAGEAVSRIKDARRC